MRSLGRGRRRTCGTRRAPAGSIAKPKPARLAKRLRSSGRLWRRRRRSFRRAGGEEGAS